MKKYYSMVVIALITFVLAFVGCKKNNDPTPEPTPTTSQYAKTIVDGLFYCSPDLLDFLDVTYTVTDFGGQETNMPLDDTIGKQFSTTEKTASMKTVVTFTPKAESEWPTIDTLRQYLFKVKGLGSITAFDSNEEIIAEQTAKLFDCISSYIGLTVNGNKMTPEHITQLQNTFDKYDKTVTFTVTNGKSVNAE